MPSLNDVLLAHQQNKKDKRVFGLVLQGGGMRAVYSAAACATLIEYGLEGAFDHVIGSSAGAINGAYFLGATADDVEVYTEDLASKKFINLLRLDKRVDIDYLVDTVMKQKRPLDIPKLLKSHSTLHIILTDAKTGQKVVISDHKKFVEIYEELRATAALPILYDKKVLVGGRWYIDGGVSDLIPIDVAVKLGCTDIVVVLTQQVESFRFDQRHTRLVNHLMKKYAANQPPRVRKLLPYNEKRVAINLRRLSHPLKKTRFYVLEPTDNESLVSIATIDKTKIARLATMGVNDTDAFLNRQQ